MLRNAGNLIGGEFKGRAYHTPAEGRNGSGEADVLHVGGVEENEETLFAVGEIFDVVRVGARDASAVGACRCLGVSANTSRDVSVRARYPAVPG